MKSAALRLRGFESLTRHQEMRYYCDSSRKGVGKTRVFPQEERHRKRSVSVLRTVGSQGGAKATTLT